MKSIFVALAGLLFSLNASAVIVTVKSETCTPIGSAEFAQLSVAYFTDVSGASPCTGPGGACQWYEVYNGMQPVAGAQVTTVDETKTMLYQSGCNFDQAQVKQLQLDLPVGNTVKGLFLCSYSENICLESSN